MVMKHNNHVWLMLAACGIMILVAYLVLSGSFGNLAGGSKVPITAGAGTTSAAASWAWLLFLACPLLHLLMMGHHGHAKGGQQGDAGEESRAEVKEEEEKIRTAR